MRDDEPLTYQDSVAGALVKLNVTAGELDDQLSRLEERLRPALRPMPPSPSATLTGATLASGGESTRAAESPLREEITGLTARIDRADHRVRTINDQLDL